VERKVDVAIVGCGPAGLSAAVNVKVRNRSLLLVGPRLCSASLHKAHRINNYLGFHGVTGEELRQKFLAHIRDMGISVTQSNVSGIYPVEGSFHLQVRDDFVEAAAVILTTGVFAARHLPDEERLVGKGISYCGTCDAMFYQGKTVAVVAESAEHEEEARFLAEVAGHVYFLPQYENVSADIGERMETIREKVKGFAGEERVRAVRLEGRELTVDGVFLLKEQLPMSHLVSGLALHDKHVRTDPEMATNIPGVYAAGDITGKPYQVAKAVGQGQQAALSAVSYIDSRIKVKV
jgi:thioredoxin reductase (NADPH)